MTRPSVLFVCVKNGGKSQMAAALMRQIAGDEIEVHSAGTKPGSSINDLSREVVQESGASMAGESTKPIDPELLARVDRAVVLGAEAVVEPAAGMRGSIETWETDEPSTRGIEGVERMRLVRDDIAARVQALRGELVGGADAQGAMQDAQHDTPTEPGPRIRVFEPALCCNTGVCGPDVDPALVRFTADLDHLQGLGADIARHNLANDPGAFAASPAVAGFLKVAGSAGLPLTLVDDVTMTTGRYPTRGELLALAGLGAPPRGDHADLGLTAESACCSGDSGAPTSCC